MQNILLISEKQSYILLSIREQLEAESYHTILSEADADQIHQISDPVSAILIYMDAELAENQQALIFIKDKAAENDTPIFIIGDNEEISAAEKLLPGHLLQQKFFRPVDAKEVVKDVNSYITKYGEQNKKKILVVDDSGAMLRNVKGWLEDHYKVILANSGTMAIKYLALNRPDLILLDYEMPVVDGKQVLEMIRSESEFTDIPVIFLTSKSDKESVMNVMSLKPEGYLLKTMEPAQIVKAVDDFFEKRKGDGHGYLL